MRPNTLLLVLVPLALAGCAASDHHGAGLDTGDIAPGASATLRFDETRAYSIHCHPHPWMEQQVVVEEGAPMNATVRIVDTTGETSTYAFEPATLRVGPGATVTYVNAGNFTHTATEAVMAH